MEAFLDYIKFDRNQKELSIEEIAYLDTLSDKEIYNIIDYCNNKYNIYNALQTGLKLILNSIYGAFGNEYFVCSTKDIAGAITAMGRDVIQYMDKINEEYWYNYWHIDEELHNYLGISNVKQIEPGYIHVASKTDAYEDEVIEEHSIIEGVFQRKVPVSCYVDTDSLFVSFEPAMESCNWEGDKQDFVMKIAKFRLEPLFLKKLKNYAKKYKVENLQEFELENISESILFITKKKYIKHVLLDDGRQYDRLTNIVPKGVDLIKKGTPIFAREKVMDIIKYLFDNPKTYNIRDLVKFVRQLRKEFELTDINDICPSTKVNAYYSTKIMHQGQIIEGPGIIEDKTDLKFAKGTYYTIKAAGLYNHLLYQHPELINTYHTIQPGTKVKIYPTTHHLNDKFCYILGEYPAEFAPDVDYDLLFEKTVSAQVNYYIEALGLPKLNKRLKVVMSLF